MRTRHSVLALAAALFLAGAPALMAQGGHFEFSGHYGRWTLNPLGNTAEKLVDDATSDEIRDRILEEIQSGYPSLDLLSYTQTVAFDSGGDNFGFSFRFYPGGHRGSFSLGVSVEKCTLKVLPTVEAQMALQDSITSDLAAFSGGAEASAVIKALAFLLTVRWDIFPSATVHPYITFGGGVSTSKALDDSVLSYAYSGQLTGSAIPTETISGEETKTLRQLRDEALEDDETDFPIPNVIPFIQLNVGLKVRLAKSVHLFVDGGVLNGFVGRGGIAIRL
jgi:hypothetical protein